MPDIIPNHVPSPRTLLAWDGTAYRPVTIDATGHIQVDVLGSALPAGAATEANQLTEITALQLIDDLRNALHSVNTDELVVRGEDQLFSFLDALAYGIGGAVSGAGGMIESAAVPAGEIWVVTHLSAWDTTSATTAHRYEFNRGGTLTEIAFMSEARPAYSTSSIATHIYMKAGDKIRFGFVGSLAGDVVGGFIHGYSMTKEV